jgi:hypothetical protein
VPAGRRPSSDALDIQRNALKGDVTKLEMKARIFGRAEPTQNGPPGQRRLERHRVPAGDTLGEQGQRAFPRLIIGEVRGGRVEGTGDPIRIDHHGDGIGRGSEVSQAALSGSVRARINEQPCHAG